MKMNMMFDQTPLSQFSPATGQESNTSTNLTSTPNFNLTCTGDAVTDEALQEIQKIKQEKEKNLAKNKASWIVRKKSYLRLCFWYILLICGVCCAVIISRGIKLKLSKSPVWEMSPQPDVVYFDDVIVASSSEACNELIMELYPLEKMQIEDLAFVMNLCLSLAEPQSSGLGGHSVMLHANAETKSCKQSTGHAKMIDLADFLEKVQASPNNAFVGPSAAMIPGHIRTYYALISMIKNTTLLQTFFQKFNLEASRGQTMSIVTKIMAEVLHSKDIDNFISERENYKYFRGNYDKISKGEGDVFNIPPDHFLRYSTYLSDFMNITSMNGGRLSGVLSSFLQKTFVQNDTSSREAERKRALWNSWIHRNEPVLIDGEILKIGVHEVCVPKEPKGFSLAARTLAKNQQKFRFSTGTVDEFLKDVSIYETIVRSLIDVTKMAQKESESLPERERERLKELEEFYKENPPNEFPVHGSSMFVIAKGNESIAFVNSLGSNFGSFHDDPYLLPGMNNLMFWAGHHFSKIGNNHNILQPIIAMKDGQISYAYAGCGGYLTRSLDLARMFTTTVFTLLFGVSIEQAVTTPLMYPMPDNNTIEYSHGAPWGRVQGLNAKKFDGYTTWISTADPAKLDQALTRPDRGIVVQQQKEGKGFKGLYFDKGGTKVMLGGA